MKRSDYPFVFWNEQYHGEDFAYELQKLPLIHLTKDNLRHLANDDGDYLQDYNIIPEEWSTAQPVKRLPFDEFCFLMHMPFLEHHIYGFFRVLNDNYESVEYADIEIGISMLSSKSMENTLSNLFNYPTNAPVSMIFRRYFDDVQLSILRKPALCAKFIDDPTGEKERYFLEIANSPEMQKWTIEVWGMLMRFFKYIETSTLYPVKIEGTKKKTFKRGMRTSSKKKNKNVLYKRNDLPVIHYLNSLPTKSSPPKQKNQKSGHASPKPHQRRKTYRTLTHPRFKNHPKYMVENAIPVKGSFVGPREAVISGNEYMVLEISEHGQILNYK